MPSAKKGKKDAKETGGVVAAVTKHASGKFANGTTPESSSDTSNSSAQSPDLHPVGTPSSNGYPAASPTLGAVPVTSVPPTHTPAPRAIPGMSESPRPSRAAIPTSAAAMAGSPGNLISLMGESPPSRWSSPRPYGTSYTSHGTHPTSVSVSPPTMSGRRPMSYLGASSPHDFAGIPTVSPNLRRGSLHSHYAQSRGSPSVAAVAAAVPAPPLPHQPQAHFYGAPDIDLDFRPRKAGIKPGQRGYHFSFDTLPSPYAGSSLPATDTVVTAGYEGGLELQAVTKRGLDPLASLTGIRGGVYHAKILPWMAAEDSPAADLFPLVAVVVHGPVLPQHETGDVESVQGGESVRGGGPETGVADTDLRSEFGGVGGGGGGGGGASFPIEYYQTTVEVYSLKHNKRVCVLLEAPRIPLAVSITSPIFQPPPPTGALHIKADAGNVVVSSAVTGECWVYRQMDCLGGGEEAIGGQGSGHVPFRFVAKLWTTLQQSPKGSAGGDAKLEAERVRAASVASAGGMGMGMGMGSSPMGQPPRHSPKQPVLSLNGRWMAYCPATPSSQISLRAHVPVASYGRVPGASTLTPPQLPSCSAEVDLPQTESVMNNIMRDATQELISGAKWVGQQGWQVLNNYWKGGSAPQSSAGGGGGAGTAGAGAGAGTILFPPTHGSTTTPAAASKEPGLVSIVDVTTLGASTTVHPITSFMPPRGCSFLSFSPTGLWLFSASTKGDVQTVWDLMRIQYTRASPLQTTPLPGMLTGPRVRQVAQFSRMTVARIVDVAWTKPNGDRLAMVTERGTVHLLDIPSSAFTWPPPRRRAVRPGAGASSTGNDGTERGSLGGGGGGVGESASTAVSYASSALTTAFDAARPLLTRPRRSSANVPPSSSSTTSPSAAPVTSTTSTIVNHAGHGGKMLAAGISHSLGKTGNALNQLRHTGENRVSLPLSTLAPAPSFVVWVTGKRSHTLFALGDAALVRVFANRSRKTTSGHRTVHLVPKKDWRLSDLPDDMLAASVKAYLDPEEYLDFTDHAGDAGDAGSNTLVLLRNRPAGPRSPSGGSGVESSIPHAEIESSAPYQPFHTDRRVALYEYEPTFGQKTEVEPEELAVEEEASLVEPASLVEIVVPSVPSLPSVPSVPSVSSLSASTIPEPTFTPTPTLPPAPPVPAMSSIMADERPASPAPRKSKKKGKLLAEVMKAREAEQAQAEAAKAQEAMEAWENNFKAAIDKTEAAKQQEKAAAAAAAAAAQQKLAKASKTKTAKSTKPTKSTKQTKTTTTTTTTTTTKPKKPATTTAWAFGQPIVATLVNTGYPSVSEEDSFHIGLEDTRALPPSAMECVLKHDDQNEQIVVTTRRRRGGGRTTGDADSDGFFEDDCEVLDFADQRV